MSDTVASLMRRAAKQLSLRGIETAALDARLLLQASAELSHSDVVAEPDLILAPEVAAKFWVLMERRSALEPVSRILATREFYGREFQVAPAVLDPRADTEVLIEAALPLGKGKGSFRILDLGTGSGAIVVTLLAELPHATGVATDISEAALAVANFNAEMHGVSDRLRFIHANWFDGLDGQFDLIVSNPPYILTDDIAGLSPDVRDFDPHSALDGGVDGLMAYRQIAAGASGFLALQAPVLVEIGAGQEPDVQRLFETNGFALNQRYPDLGGHIRCLRFNLPR
jgi:release factor glutamine methyltransferase